MIDPFSSVAAPFPAAIPVLEPDALTLLVDPTPTLGELGAVSFARDIATWLARIFDRPVERIVYRENPWDHRDCLRAQSYEFTVAGHTIVITGYDPAHPYRRSSTTRYAIVVDDRPVPYNPERPPRGLAWHLAWHAWHASM